MSTPRLILASASPRRRELLGMLAVPFEVIAGQFDESSIPTVDLTPDEWVIRLAEGKARDVASRTDGTALIIGADTTVILDGDYLNKPRDAAEAHAMLRRLSGRTHQVYTGLCLLSVDRDGAVLSVTDFARTEVTFDTLTDDVIGAYVATGEPLDKAGAYGIQGKALSFIPRIDGDYFNVVGLPLAHLRRLLMPYFHEIEPVPAQPIFPNSAYYGKNTRSLLG